MTIACIFLKSCLVWFSLWNPHFCVLLVGSSSPTIFVFKFWDISVWIYCTYMRSGSNNSTALISENQMQGLVPLPLTGGSELAFFTIIGCWRNGALLSLPPSSLLRESSTLREGRENIQSYCCLSLLHLTFSLRGMNILMRTVKKIDPSGCFPSFFAL